jgi:hypothetical protein
MYDGRKLLQANKGSGFFPLNGLCRLLDNQAKEITREEKAQSWQW